MFERYSERARRVIFFSRYEASMCGSRDIGTEHLLLGIIRESPDLFKAESLSVDLTAMSEEIRATIEQGEKLSTSVDLGLNPASKRVLARAVEESEVLQQRRIGPGHLLLALLEDSSGPGAQILARHGLTRELVIRGIQQQDKGDLSTLVNTLPANLLAQAKQSIERLFGPRLTPASESHSRVDNGVLIVETNHRVSGHDLATIETFRVSEDGKKIIVTYEFRGPRGNFRGETELDT